MDDKNAWYHQRGSLRYKLQSWFSRLSRGWIKSPFYVAWLALHESKDEEVQASSRLPIAQKANYWLVTAVEYYTPAQIKNLEAGLARLKEARGHALEDSLSEQIRRFRESPGSSLELYLHDENDDSFTSIGHLVQLPEFCSHAHGTILNLTPSLSALTISFFIKKCVRERINEALHKTYPVYLEQTKKGGIRTFDTKAQHSKIVTDFECRLSKGIDTWYAKNAPGFYTSAQRARPLNIVASVENAHPFRKNGECYDILHPMDLQYAPLLYRPIKANNKLTYDCMYFAPRRSISKNNFSYITGTQAAFNRLKSDIFGRDELSPAYYIDMVSRRSMGVWWLSHLLQTLRREAVKARDHAHGQLNPWRSWTQLHKLQDQILILADGLTVSREINEYREYSIRHMLEFEAYTFNRFGEKEATRLSENLDSTIQRESAMVRDHLKDLNSFLYSQTGILSAIHALRLQVVVIIVSLLSISIAVFSLFKSAVQ
ncbi:hypothetical protein [Pseudoblastomonas halimionae]|uniref:Uncharacterized protein n=1 Tax=Alteriqipengyuania halimionae TaxID=1926630 RepID=A0A6I4U6D2_9SPHN|nr:hypothetical protein [Alteriqipengyuania halimionae]MXP10012.1 hypothetical protein [Alteriqipengyuania halimionae]